MTTRTEALEAVAEAARTCLYAISHHTANFAEDMALQNRANMTLANALFDLDAAPADIDDAAAERAKIVAWLRESANMIERRFVFSYQIILLRALADKFERGEHDKAGDQE